MQLTFPHLAHGVQAGYRGPGGLHEWTPTSNNTGCIGGITGYIDRAFFSSPHIYGNPTAKSVYSASAFDPEGMLGSLASMFQVFLGYQAGFTLQVRATHQHPMVQVFPGHKDRVARWAGWSILTGGLGALLCGASQEGGWVPINKNLWSLSYVLVTSSFAFALLAMLYIVIDVKNWWKGQPFFYAGMNSILLYCGHQVTAMEAQPSPGGLDDHPLPLGPRQHGDACRQAPRGHVGRCPLAHNQLCPLQEESVCYSLVNCRNKIQTVCVSFLPQVN